MNDFRISTYPRFYYFLLALFLILFIPDGFADNPQRQKLSLDTDTWIFHSEVKGVKIYYQITFCKGNSVVYLKFNNTNTQKVEVSWKETFFTKQLPDEQESYLGQKHLILTPGEIAQSECNQIKVKECITFSYEALPTYKADIIKINLKEISVSAP